MTALKKKREALIVGHADCIVTDDKWGFDDEVVSQYGIEVIDADSNGTTLSGICFQTTR